MKRWRSTLDYAPGKYPLTVLLDLFFTLLVVFMLGNSVVFWPGTPVEPALSLPRDPHATMQVADKLIVTITKNNQVYFNDKALKKEELEKELRERLRESYIASEHRRGDDEGSTPGHAPMLVLRADRNLPYETIMEIMSLARSLELGVFLVTDVEKFEAGTPQVPGEPSGK